MTWANPGDTVHRSLPQSILFPSPTCLNQVLDLLNHPELVAVWGDDETIGWIYQYFTPPELRDQVRKEFLRRATAMSWLSATSFTPRVTWLSS